jgi:type II secretory pathway component PulJ
MSGERGEIGLMQLLVATAILLVILGATLTVFTTSEQINRNANARNDSQDNARRGLDQLTRELRNLASPTPEQPQAVDAAGPLDLVFQTVDAVGPNSGLNAANVERVRYCLGGTTSAGILYRQEQRWTTQLAPAVPSTTACPSADVQWSVTRQIAFAVTNRNGGVDRPLFTYNAAAAADITSVHAQLFVDLDPARSPPETALSSGVFLRNQNRKPVASFTADTTVPAKVILNGAASSDPEGEALDYQWYDGTTKVGTGIRFDYTVTRGTSHTLQLKVFDPARLEGDAPTQVVTAP